MSLRDTRNDKKLSLSRLGGEGGEPVRPSAVNGPEPIRLSLANRSERSEEAHGKLREPGEVQPASVYLSHLFFCCLQHSPLPNRLHVFWVMAVGIEP